MESQKKDIIVDLETNGDFCVHDIKAKIDTFTPKGQCLFRLKNKSNGKLIRVRADSDGRPNKIFKKSGDNVTHGEVVIEYKIEECQHTTVMKNMCAECGVDLQQENSHFSKSSASVAIVHNIPELKVSSSFAQNLGQEDEQRLLKDRKLVLLVDLDQTLIHTTDKNIAKSAKKSDIIDFQLSPTSPWYHCKIRPGTSEFLKKISQHYELHIVTFGSRPYAHKIAGFLDPDGKYFSHRILSRDECFDSRSKTANLASLFPCGDQMVCIIDDRQDVWNSAPNLIQVKPYIFFKNTGDINAPPGTSENQKKNKKNEVVLDDHDPDHYLVYLEEILINIHRAFYKAYDEDDMSTPKSIHLKNIIPSLKQKVLREINIVFTGLVPNNEPLKQSHAFKIATSLGANVQDTITKDTTHLVANRRGTGKYVKAKKNPKIEIVSPEWLWSCAERWKHVSERLFRLTKVKENSKDVRIETSFDDSIDIEQGEEKTEEIWDEEDFEIIEKEIEKMLDDNSRKQLCP